MVSRKVIALQRLVVAGPEAARAREIAQRVVDEVVGPVVTARPAQGVIRGLLAGRRRKQEALAAVERLTGLLAEFPAEARPRRRPAAGHFRHRVVEPGRPSDGAALGRMRPPGECK